MFFCLSQIMLLETSRRYNPAIDSITFLKDFSYNKEDFAKAGSFVHFYLPNNCFYYLTRVCAFHLSESKCFYDDKNFSAVLIVLKKRNNIYKIQHMYASPCIHLIAPVPSVMIKNSALIASNALMVVSCAF